MQSKSKRQLGYFVSYSCCYELNNLSDILRNQIQLCLYLFSLNFKESYQKLISIKGMKKCKNKCTDGNDNALNDIC